MSFTISTLYYSILIEFWMFILFSSLLSQHIQHRYSDSFRVLLLTILLHCRKMVYPSIIMVRIMIIIHPSTRISYVSRSSRLGSCLRLTSRSGLTSRWWIGLWGCRIGKIGLWLWGMPCRWGHVMGDPRMGHPFRWVQGWYRFRNKFQTYPW